MSRRIIIEDIIALERLQELATPAEWSAAQEFNSLKRREEWLSWRVYLRRELGDDIEIRYSDIGAPYIVDSALHISISHTRNRVAIIISDNPCAVDIELVSRNFSSVSTRYTSQREKETITRSNEPQSLAIAWCAKEAAYKYANGGATDFLKDIIIEGIKPSNHSIAISLKGQIIEAKYSIAEDYVVVTID